MVGTVRRAVRCDSFGASGRSRPTSSAINEGAVHDENIDITFLRMPKRGGQRPNDVKAELFPQMNRRFVRRNDKVELHRAKTEPARFV